MNMKKIFKYILLSALTIAAVASCEDDRNNFLPEDSFGFNNKANENVTTLPLYGGKHTLNIIKSGKGFNEGTVTITVVDTLLTAFNAANETSFVALPADKGLYSFSTESLAFTPEDVTLPVDIIWDVAKVSEHMAQNPDKEFCIPVSIASDDLEINEGRDFFVLNLTKSTLTSRQKELSSAVLWESEPTRKELRINTQLDMAIDAFDFTIEFDQDEELVATYNEANGTSYEFAPKGLVTSGENPVMKAGEDEAIFTLELNTSILVDEATGTVKRDWEGYVVPVRIKSLSQPGINIDNDVTYVVVKGLKPLGKQLFERVWGYYSDGALEVPWFLNGGLAVNELANQSYGGNDRSFTVDDEFVYVASASAVPGIHKFDLMTGQYVGTLNVDGWMKDPYIGKNDDGSLAVLYPTYATCCPRMVPNTDPSINGGKDILLVGGLAEGAGTTLRLYAYVNGIDEKAEKVYDLSVARRFGDKMSFTGTWQSGKFWFRANENGDGGFPLVANIPVNEGKVQSWIAGHRINNADNVTTYEENGEVKTQTCISEVYWTPQSNGDVKDYCLISTQSEKGLHLMTGTSVAGAATELGVYPKLACTFGWNFFEYKGIKLMAFVSVLDKTRPTVQVIKGDYTTISGLKAALDAYGEDTIVFSAPLQDQYDNEVCGFKKGMFLGDCCVREINGEIYMVAGTCAVGLSMFRLDKNFVLE